MGPVKPISGRAGQEVGWGLGPAEVGSGTPGLLQARGTNPLGEDAWGSRSPASLAAWHHLLPLDLCCRPGYVANRRAGTWERRRDWGGWRAGTGREETAGGELG